MKLLVAMRPGVGESYQGMDPPVIQGKGATSIPGVNLLLYVLEVEAAFEIEGEK